MAKSYYAILGVSDSASPEEIRASYRRLVKIYHPDHFSGSRNIFHDIQEAYDVLGDERRRRRYEKQLGGPPRRPPRPYGTPSPEPLIPDEAPVDFGEISPTRSFRTATPSFDEIFDWLWQNFSSLGPPKSGRIENLTMSVPLSPEQARRGGTARVMVPARAVCPECRGYGRIGPYACRRCAGEGALTGEVPVAIAFPPGLIGDHAVRVPLARFGIRNLHLTVLFRPTGG